jgi:hypothetical protein
MLFSYLQGTQLLLADKTQIKFNPQDLIGYINTARGQVAGEGQCVRGMTTLATANGTQSYPFSAITLPSGASAVFNVRMITNLVGAVTTMLTPRPWPWFNYYNIATVAVFDAAPTIWAQLGEGVAGTIYLSPIPNAVYSLSLDATLDVSALATDSDLDLIPYPWSDAVRYYAAYLALAAERGKSEQEAAQDMWVTYQEFMRRARKFATTPLLPGNRPKDWTPVQAKQGAA